MNVSQKILNDFADFLNTDYKISSLKNESVLFNGLFNEIDNTYSFKDKNSNLTYVSDFYSKKNTWMVSKQKVILFFKIKTSSIKLDKTIGQKFNDIYNTYEKNGSNKKTTIKKNYLFFSKEVTTKL